MLTIFVLFASALAIDCVWANECPLICTMDYTPVCCQSSSTGELKTFSNSCLMAVKNCEDGCDYEVISDGECFGDDCPTICPKIYSPVCGQSQWSGELKTFPNDCEMKVENCRNGGDYQLISNKECSGDACPTVCPHIYNPVCGRSQWSGELKTFSSSCSLNVENCRNGGDYELIMNNECPGDAYAYLV